MKPRFELRYLPTALLLLVALLLILLIGGELGWGQHIKSPLPQPKPQQTKMTLATLHQEFVLPPMEQAYSEFIGRPLFVPTRRPPPPPPPVAPPLPTMRKGQFMLLGVILTKAKNVALLREVATGKVSRIEQGKEINGILVEKLEPEKITLKQWDDREELVLKIQPQPKILQAAQMPQPGGVAGFPGQPGIPPQVPHPSAPVQQAGPPSAMPNDLQGLIARRRGLAP